MAASTWTDERLDDGFDAIDARFDQVDARFDRVDARFDRIDARLDGEFRRIDTEFREVRGAIGDLRLMMFRIGGGIMVGLVGVMAPSSSAAPERSRSQ